ncbi:trans-aconitate 2-methyltransferase [Sphaerisporangium fuscum]|uniref:trans-aconitate 2-methyltransferase n=1 Tax=Sphaerisporangium fuscum TaxID=2835868 RepID=UPI00202999FE|nr:trans-aconitate 2-methyltransferase [Sphaerisporangium fuscum]
MSRDIWDPAVYGRYADERARPFFELTARIHAAHPTYVVDLGCGTGELTAELSRRWPGAAVHGVDSSPAMIDKAPEGPTFSVGDIRSWRPGRPVDVIVSNAALHWVPEHRELLPRWIAELNPGGWLAFQVPGNHGAPSHALVRELCLSEAWKDELAGLVGPEPVDRPEGYLDLLAGLGCEVDAWETTYVHVLHGEDAVLNWIRGTALRPMLDRLDPGRRETFLADCARLLDRAYPRRSYGTAFPFRRVFVVARKPEEEGAG